LVLPVLVFLLVLAATAVQLVVIVAKEEEEEEEELNTRELRARVAWRGAEGRSSCLHPPKACRPSR
jgi:hypothetical protein